MKNLKSKYSNDFIICIIKECLVSCKFRHSVDINVNIS